MNLYIIYAGGTRKISNVTVTDSGYVITDMDKDPTPLEDYGNFLLTKDDLTLDEAWNEWMENMFNEEETE